MFAGRKLDETLTPALADGGVRSVWRPYRGQGEGQRPGTQLGSESVSAGTRDQDNRTLTSGP